MIKSLNPSSNGQCKIIAYQAKSSDGCLTHISASSLKLFLSCGLKWYFKKVLKLPEPTSPSLHLGKAVHAGLQAYNVARWRDDPHDAQVVLKTFHKALSEQEESDPVQFKEGEQQKISDTGENLLNAYLDSDYAKLDEKPIGVEVQLEEDFPQLPSPLLGYIDLVRPGNTVVDYKTCAATPNLELEAFQHELQLTAYQLLVEEATGEQVEGRELVFLVKTKTPKVIVHRLPPADQAAKGRFWAIAQAAVEGIYVERFVPSPGLACSWCSFRKECSAWRGGSL